MYARVARYEVPSERRDEAVESFREAAAKVTAFDGMEGGYVLVGDDGRVMTVTLWSNRATLETSETRASIARQGAARAVDGEVQSVEEYEVVDQMLPTAAG